MARGLGFVRLLIGRCSGKLLVGLKASQRVVDDIA